MRKTFLYQKRIVPMRLFLTGTFGAQTPVGDIDGRVIGDGTMGPVTSFLRQAYKKLISKVTD